MLRFSLILFLLVGAVVNLRAQELIDVDNYQALTDDKRSFRVGEPLVILVAESTVAESSAGTDVGKDVRISASASTDSNQDSIGFGLSGSDTGAGQTVRTGSALTQISVNIVARLPNEMLRIEGRKALTINGEDQVVYISGTIREYDISKDNSVLSNRISDANIEIQGDGDVSDAQRKSMIYKVLTWLRLV